MKKAIIFTLLLISIKTFSQQNPPNYSFLKLVITNESNEILVVKWDGEWEVPGSKFITNGTLTNYLELIALDSGVEISDIKLGGLFTFHYNNRDYPTLMHYYKANYKSGELKVPEECEAVKWMTYDDAMEAIPFTEMKLIIEIINGSDAVYTGAFDIIRKTETTPRTSSIRQSIAKL